MAWQSHLVIQLKWEMKDDPNFEVKKPWCWKKYFAHAAKQSTFGTASCFQAYCRMTSTTVHIYQEARAGDVDSYYLAWSEEPPAPKGACISLLRRGAHYDF